MPNYSDVTVTITSTRPAVTQIGFGVPLIFSTSGAHDYKEYNRLSEVEVDFAQGTPEYAMAQAIFAQDPAPEKIAIYGIAYASGTDPVTDLSDALNTLVKSHNDWYFLLCTESGAAEIAELDSWVSGTNKMFFTRTTNQADPVNYNSERTVMFFGTNADTEYPDAAWVGRCAPEPVGRITWKYKTLEGISTEAISVDDLETLHDNGGVTYINKFGTPQTSEGIATNGSYIDVTRSKDWIVAEMTKQVHELLFSVPKIPYTLDGVAMVVDRVKRVLELAVDQGIIDKDADGNGLWTVVPPSLDEIDAAKKEQRILPGVYFEATPTGAVHGMEITGVVFAS